MGIAWRRHALIGTSAWLGLESGIWWSSVLSPRFSLHLTNPLGSSARKNQKTSKLVTCQWFCINFGFHLLNGNSTDPDNYSGGGQSTWLKLSGLWGSNWIAPTCSLLVVSYWSFVVIWLGGVASELTNGRHPHPSLAVCCWPDAQTVHSLIWCQCTTQTITLVIGIIY